MIISAKLIREPRVERRCERCGSKLEPPYLRLYGAAYSSDPPYVIYAHLNCSGVDPKLSRIRENMSSEDYAIAAGLAKQPD